LSNPPTTRLGILVGLEKDKHSGSKAGGGNSILWQCSKDIAYKTSKQFPRQHLDRLIPWCKTITMLLTPFFTKGTFLLEFSGLGLYRPTKGNSTKQI